MADVKCPQCNDTRQKPASHIDAPWNRCPDCTREALFARIEALEAEIERQKQLLIDNSIYEVH